MSFSIQFVAPNKTEAARRFIEQLDATVGYQIAHKKDRAAIETAGLAYIHHLDEDETKEVSVNIYGSVMWDAVKYPDYSKAPHGLTFGNLTINVSLVPRAEAPAGL